MTDERARHALEQLLPQGWALDGVKPVFGSQWEVELVEFRDGRDVRMSVSATSFAAAVEAARTCGSLSTLVDELPSRATVEIFVAARTED